MVVGSDIGTHTLLKFVDYVAIISCFGGLGSFQRNVLYFRFWGLEWEPRNS